MALGRKSLERTNAELQARVAACDQHGPYIALAEEIRTRAATEAAAVAEGTIDQRMDAIVADLTAQQRRALLLEQLTGLPPETRFNLLAKHCGDIVAKEAIDHERKRLAFKDQKDKAIRVMQNEVDDLNRIDLAKVPEGFTASIALYHKGNMISTDAAELERDKKVYWYRQLSTVSQGDGLFLVNADYIDSNSIQRMFPEHTVEVTPDLENKVVELGGNFGLAEGRQHQVYFGSSLWARDASGTQLLEFEVRKGSQNYEMPLGVGYFGMSDAVIMGDRSRNRPEYGGREQPN